MLRLIILEADSLFSTYSFYTLWKKVHILISFGSVDFLGDMGKWVENILGTKASQSGAYMPEGACQ